MTAITDAAVLARLAVIQREIISPELNRPVTAYDNVPFTISNMDMPLFINWVKTMTKSDIIGEDAKGRDFNETTNYDMVLYHSSFTAGISQENAGLLTPYFDLVLNKFGSYPHLKGLNGVLDAHIISHSGATTVTFLSQPYNGIRFTLAVIAKVRRPLASLE
jgi:hypothetical protein